mmetsp:Transcript_29186/g.41074  ORF Transcript_29186/g.41074 Transcript_29186/m.41074 type:complete len:284 (+) Transcript_29186:76-927(+)
MSLSLNDVDLAWIEPQLGTESHVFMLESFCVKCGLHSSLPVQLLRPQLWTNATHKLNPEGDWHGIDMTYKQKDQYGNLVFQVSFLPTSSGNFEYTVRIGLNNKQTQIQEWKWAGSFGKNGSLKVSPPNDDMPWTKGPQTVEISPNVFIGNFIAASQAKELGFHAVLNMAQELDIVPPSSIQYKKIAIPDGANHPIPAEEILDAVRWVEQRVRQHCKVLVHCRAGIGRSGSIGIAYLFYSHPEISYKETLEQIWKVKNDIFPHKDLEATLEKLFPRKKSENNNS